MSKLDHEVNIEEVRESLSDFEIVLASQIVKGDSKKIITSLGNSCFVVEIKENKTKSEHSFDSLDDAVDCYNNQ